MLTQTIMVFLMRIGIDVVGHFGVNQLGRPIVVATMMGFIMGDVKTAIVLGATLELIWLGAFAIGASNPPDYTTGTIFGVAAVLTTGADVATAVLLAVPLATLMRLISDLRMTLITPLIGARADYYAELGDEKGVIRCHYVAFIIKMLINSGLVALGFYFGMPVIETVIGIIPAWFSNGLSYATGIIPAIGFAMIARMIMSKQLACFFFLGFLLAAYLNLPIIGIVGIACVLVAILLLNNGKSSSASAAGEIAKEEDNNEF